MTDWARDPVERRSRNDYVFMLSNATISWNSVKQKAIAQSSAEVKYYTAAEATKEAI